MLGFTETGQVRVEGRDGRTFVTEIDLNLAEVLPLFEQVCGVGMAQTVHMNRLFDPGGLETQTKGALKSRAAHRFGGGGSALAMVAFGGEEQRGMFVGSPLFAQELESALRQGDVPIAIAFGLADVQKHAAGVDVGHGDAQAFAQAQTAGIDGGQTNAMVQSRDGGEDVADFLG